MTLVPKIMHKKSLEFARENGHEMGKVFAQGVCFCKKCGAFISPRYTRYTFTIEKPNHSRVHYSIKGFNEDLISNRCNGGN